MGLVHQLNSEMYSETDAFFIFNGLLKQLNDGHSNVKFSEERTKQFIKYGTFFPYELEFFDSTAVVTGSISDGNKQFYRREIFKINNVPIKKILKDLAVVAMMDGEFNESASEWLAEDFWFYFSLYNGFRSSYSITYLENGKQLHEIAKAVSRIEFLKSSFLEDYLSEPVELSYIAGKPVLDVANFDQKSAWWWRRKVRRVFKELKKNDDNELVLDLRDNGGGQENLQNILLKAFGISATEKYEVEAIKTFEFKNVNGLMNSHFERLKSFGLENFMFTNRVEKGFRHRKLKKCRGRNKSLFEGDLYVLFDGTTFSCASDAAAILKRNYPKTVLLGTETRGSGKINYAGYFMHVSLPNTHMQVRIPRVKYVLKDSEFSADSGVIPDVQVEMKKEDIQSNIDTQLTYIINLLYRENDRVKSN